MATNTEVGLKRQNHMFSITRKSSNVDKIWAQFPYSESDSIERYNRGLTERFWRGKGKGLADLCLLDLSDLSSFIPRSKEAALWRTEQSAKKSLKEKNKMAN